jgi:hypothetical protein
MDFISGLRTVDFRVWISYLDVHFDYPNAVARLTVDRASAYGTPTCVFQINNSEGFRVGPPNIDLNKSRSFLFWLWFTHSWGCALAPRKFTEDMPLHPANLPMKELFGLHSLNPSGCNSGSDFLWTYRNVDCYYLYCMCLVRLFWCLLYSDLVSYAIVLANFCFSPPAYCPGNLVFYTSRFLWLKIRLIAAFQKVYVRIHWFVYCCTAMLHFAPAHFTFLQQWNVSLKMVMQLRL